MIRCIDGCTRGNRWNGADYMTKCSMCLIWVHPSCLGDDEEDQWLKEGNYTCDECRTTGQNIVLLKSLMMEQQENIKLLHDALQQQQHQITNLTTLMTSQIEKNNTHSSPTVAAPVARPDHPSIHEKVSHQLVSGGSDTRIFVIVEPQPSTTAPPPNTTDQTN